MFYILLIKNNNIYCLSSYFIQYEIGVNIINFANNINFLTFK